MRSTRNRSAPLQMALAGAVILLLAAPAPGQELTARIEWELATNRDFLGPIQQAALDDKNTYLATTAMLYHVRGGKAQPIAEPLAENARLVLAPGAGIYAWLVPDETTPRLCSARLMDMSGRELAKLRLEEFPYGFGGIHLGFQGKMIVTVTPLDDWQGLDGRVQFTFWNREGRMLNKVIRPAREMTVVGADGQSLLVLGNKGVAAYSNTGEHLWDLKNRYRKAALARGGKLALLNPAPPGNSNEVHIFTGSGNPTIVKTPTPVHHLRIAPDGSAAVVGGDVGRYFYLDPSTGRLDEGPKLPADDALFIADLELINADTVALGVLHRRGDPPQHTWPEGSIMVINRRGNVALRRAFPIRDPIASRPAIDANYGYPALIGSTLDATIRVNLAR